MNKGIFTKGLLLGFVLLTVSTVWGQASPETEATIDDLKVSPMRIPALSEISGSPFLTTDFKNAVVHLKNNKYVPDIPVKFNTYNNFMIVKMDDGQELKLDDFKSVEWDEKSDNGTLRHFHFAMGYPEIDKHSEKAVYQVLSSGPNAHLLKFITQKVEDANTLGDYSRRELVKTEQLYLYIPGKEIKRIKASKKDIADALPALAGKIEEIAANNNLKLKSESELVALVEALNKP
jgi:hypothetical protein